MPWVEVCRDPKVIGDELFEEIVSILPYVVARAFDVPDDEHGRLTANDIEIKTADFNRFDKHSQPLAIIIRTEEFAARRANLDKRRDEVITAIEEILPENIHGFVWVRPLEGSFGEF